MKNILLLLIGILICQSSTAQNLTVTDAAGKLAAKATLTAQKVSYVDAKGITLGNAFLSPRGVEYRNRNGRVVGAASFHGNAAFYRDNTGAVVLTAVITGNTTTYYNAGHEVILEAFTQNDEIIYKDTNDREIAKTAVNTRRIFQAVSRNTAKIALDLINVFDDIILGLSLNLNSLPPRVYTPPPTPPPPAGPDMVLVCLPQTVSSSGQLTIVDMNSGYVTVLPAASVAALVP